MILSEIRNKRIVDPMQRELTGSRCYEVFQVSWDTISEIDHQKQRKSKNYSGQNIIDKGLLILMIILTA